MEENMLNSEMIWKIWKKAKFNGEKIGKIRKKSKSNSEKTWTIWKKSKWNSEMIWKIWKIYVLVIVTPKRDILLLRRRRRHRLRDSVEIPPKTRYKQKQNETYYENITH